MSWSADVQESLAALYGAPTSTHQVDGVVVLECPQADGSVVYATAGLSEGVGYSAKELVLHAVTPDPRLAKLLGRIGLHPRCVHGHTLQVESGGPDDPFAAVGFLFSGKRAQLEGGNVSLLQVCGLTQEELAVARADSLYTVEAAWWRDAVGRRCSPGRDTSPSLAGLRPVRPAEAVLESLSPAARRVVEVVVHGDSDEAEGMRGEVSADDARVLARTLSDSLPHPAQLATLLHVMMDETLPELKLAALRLLQLDPAHHDAVQLYRDALSVLRGLEGGSWSEAYDAYGDFELAAEDAAQRRSKAGLGIAFP